MADTDDRQQRLKRLREEAAIAPAAQDASIEPAAGGSNSAQQANDAEQNVAIPEVKFRNYKPRDDKFAESKVRSGLCASPSCCFWMPL